MHYGTNFPSQSLSKYIKYYWTLEDVDNTLTKNKERIFPDGCIELIFHYGDLFKKYANENAVGIQPRNFIHGQIKQFMEVEATGKIGVFSIRFKPAGLWPFLPMDIAELTGNAVSVQSLWGSDGVTLEEKMMTAASTNSRIEIVEDFLLQRLKNANPKYTAIDFCVHSILNSSGYKSIETLSNEVNTGRRQLERKFAATVGLSPKLFSRIVRFQHTLQRIENNPANSLTGIAHANGFYDQSHFIKDFKEFTGLNPKQYFGASLEFAKYLTT